MARSSTRTHDDSARPPASGLLIGVGLLAGCGIMALISQLGSATGGDVSTGPDTPLALAVGRMADRFDDLVDQQGDIARRMTDLELAMLGAAAHREVMPITSDGTAVEISEIRESMAQFENALSSGDNLAKGPIVDQVIEAMRYIDEQEDADREVRRDERRQERLDQQLLDLTETLDLDANQQLSMKDLLADAAEKRRALDDETASRNERRESRDALRADTQTTAAGFLSPVQIQLLEDSGGLDVRGGRDFGDWFGGGGGGGGRGRGR